MLVNTMRVNQHIFLLIQCLVLLEKVSFFELLLLVPFFVLFVIAGKHNFSDTVNFFVANSVLPCFYNKKWRSMVQVPV